MCPWCWKFRQLPWMPDLKLVLQLNRQKMGSRKRAVKRAVKRYSHLTMVRKLTGMFRMFLLLMSSRHQMPEVMKTLLWMKMSLQMKMDLFQERLLMKQERQILLRILKVKYRMFLLTIRMQQVQKFPQRILMEYSTGRNGSRQQMVSVFVRKQQQ